MFLIGPKKSKREALNNRSMVLQHTAEDRRGYLVNFNKMKFERIEGFRKMTEEAMKNTLGGVDATDSTRNRLDTMKVPKPTNCLISDGKGGKINTFDYMD